MKIIYSRFIYTCLDERRHIGEKKWITGSTSLPIAAVTYRIDWVSETIFNLYSRKWLRPNSNSCDIFDINRIMVVIKRVKRRLYETYNFIFEDDEAIIFSQNDIYLVPLKYSRWKERIFEKKFFKIIK